MTDQLDLGELLDGFSYGKALRIQEWRDRKERRAFIKVCIRFRHQKWHREVRAENGERLERLRVRGRDKMRRKRSAMSIDERDDVNAQQRFDRLKAWKNLGEVHTCRNCDAQWCSLPTTRQGRKPQYCSQRCKNAWTRRQ